MPVRKNPMPPRSTVTPLLPVTIQPGNIRYAPGVRAGRWVFATGHKGMADFVSGMAPEVTDESAPRHGLPKHKKEALRIFANLAKVLDAGGTDQRGARAAVPHEPCRLQRRLPALAAALARPALAILGDRGAGARRAGRRRAAGSVGVCSLKGRP